MEVCTAHSHVPLLENKELIVSRSRYLVPVDSSARQGNCCGPSIRILINRKYDPFTSFARNTDDPLVYSRPLTHVLDYVPYILWHNNEASLANVFEIARQNFKHEMLVSNFVGIPVHQQHGSDDDNVPAYHSRLMHQLIKESGWYSTYDELPGKGHWFDGVLTTNSLVNFYRRSANTNQEATDDLLPLEFSIVIPSSAEMGSRGGLIVDQLQSPDRYGHIEVVRNENLGTWRLRTSNIHRFHILPSAIRGSYPERLFVDNNQEPFILPSDETRPTWLVRIDGCWQLSQDSSWRCPFQRYGKQVGAMDAILRTDGPFSIVSASLDSNDLAVQISRNFFQYFSADSRLIFPFTKGSDAVHSGNVISLFLGSELGLSTEGFPIQLHDKRLQVTRAVNEQVGVYPFEPGLGAIFLRPLPNERLELVIWGVDLAGLHHAARLVPTITGTGQPDFVVTCFHCRTGGRRGGILAAGFFDYSWEISMGSYIS